MITFENTIEIQRPINEVFDFIANFENTPKWNYFVTSVRQIEGNEAGIGAVYHQTRQTDAQTYYVTAYEPNRLVTVETVAGTTPGFERRMTFEPTATGTRIIDHWRLIAGINPLVALLGKGKMKAAVAENLGKLKQLLENHETRLQDGRLMTLSGGKQ